MASIQTTKTSYSTRFNCPVSNAAEQIVEEDNESAFITCSKSTILAIYILELALHLVII